MEQIQPASPDDVFIWPDETWCYRHELHSYSYMSDDHRVIAAGTPEWEEWTQEQDV